MEGRISVADLLAGQHILDDLANEVNAEEGTLAGGTRLGVGGQVLQELRQTEIRLGNPMNDLIHLTPELFESVNAPLTPIRKQQMREGFDFYYLTLTVLMKPGRGVQFSRVECSLDLGPKGANEPIVQAIFPTSEWRDVLQWGGSLSLALSGDLNWKAGIDTQEEIQNLPGHVQAKLEQKSDLKALIVVPKFSFGMGRPDVAAIGEGSSGCFWRIDKPELRQTQTVQLGVVFKVPKGTTTLQLEGLVAVEPNMRWLTMQLRDVFEFLSTRFQNLIRDRDDQGRGKDRLLIGDHEKWRLDLPKRGKLID